MKKQLLFLLLCATISFNGWAQSITFTSATLTTAVIGSTITVNYKYTNPTAGNIYCAINLQESNWDFVSEVVGAALSPAPAGTDVVGSFNFTIPSGTTPTANLTGGRNYKIYINLNNAGWTYLTGDFPPTEINLTAPLGIDKKNVVNGLAVYPNPVSDILKIANADNLANASFSIVDILGKTVIQSKALNNNAIDVSNLSSGVYVLSVSSENGAKQFKFQKK